MTKDELNNRKLWVETQLLVASKQKRQRRIHHTRRPHALQHFSLSLRMRQRTYPEIELEIIPGVTSVDGPAASAKLPLAEKEEVVTIISL